MAFPGFGHPPALYFLWALPRNLFSRACGWVADLALPRFLLDPLIKLFCLGFRVNLEEALQPEGGYRTFNEFFTRRLRRDARIVVDSAAAISCPVDGAVGEFGRIHKGCLIQAKGLEYRLEDLLVDPKRSRVYEEGTFITLYLAPHNYHRIHSHVEGIIHEYAVIPGDLWTVSPLGVNHVRNLFARNERMITYFSTQYGECALIKVGATVVGRIRVCYHNRVSNRPRVRPSRITLEKPYHISRGEELGVFELGSTVICLFPPGQINLEPQQPEQEVRFGQLLGRFRITNDEETLCDE